MSVSNEITRKQQDATIALDILGRLIERLDVGILAGALQVRSSDDLETLRMALATLTDAVERETIKREDAGLSQEERGQ